MICCSNKDGHSGCCHSMSAYHSNCISVQTASSNQFPVSCPAVIGKLTEHFGYWNCSQFPGFELAAKKYLSAPPTSVASKQLFGVAGQIYADRRSNLLGENAEKLLFLSYNIRLFNLILTNVFLSGYIYSINY